jgi:sugar lactone lactonase YvrE
MRSPTIRIRSVTPPAGIPGGKIVIEGSGFDPEESSNIYVNVGGASARPTLVSKSRIVSLIPEEATVGPILVTVKDKKSNSVEFTVGKRLIDNVHPVDNPVYDKHENLYVTYSGKRGETVPVSVYKISPDGSVNPFLSNVPNATSLAFDKQGNLFISSRFEGCVYRATPQADVSIFAKDLGVPTGVAFDREGVLFVGDRGGRILKLTSDGKSSVFAEVPESTVAFHLAFDLEGNLLVSSPSLSSYNHIYMIDRFGKVIPMQGGFGRPQGITVDKSGNLYLCEAKAGDSAVYKISPTGQVTALLTGPVMVGVALDKKNNLAVASQDSVYFIPINGHH